ncbi:MAG: hypothetical protein CM1200mP41_39700 [Gammaproteobacteria bacterium]|nr:MAG: hypothetical protein CM1200mP41_39700 [Gammaproteobacteria bacterium]
MKKPRTLTREIWQRWTANDDPNISQLMQIGIRGLSYSSYRRALQSFDQVIEMAPEFAEGWNRRATLYYHIKEYRGSIDDIKQTLRLEPRHFGAWSGLGLISVAQDNYSGALAAFKKACRSTPTYPTFAAMSRNSKTGSGVRTKKTRSR